MQVSLWYSFNLGASAIETTVLSECQPIIIVPILKFAIVHSKFLLSIHYDHYRVSNISWKETIFRGGSKYTAYVHEEWHVHRALLILSFGSNHTPSFFDSILTISPCYVFSISMIFRHASALEQPRVQRRPIGETARSKFWAIWNTQSTDGHDYTCVAHVSPRREFLPLLPSILKRR